MPFSAGHTRTPIEPGVQHGPGSGPAAALPAYAGLCRPLAISPGSGSAPAPAAAPDPGPGSIQGLEPGWDPGPVCLASCAARWRVRAAITAWRGRQRLAGSTLAGRHGRRDLQPCHQVFPAGRTRLRDPCQQASRIQQVGAVPCPAQEPVRRCPACPGGRRHIPHTI